MSLLTYRRFHMFVSKWQVGTALASGYYCNEKSGVELEWEENDPWIRLPIPGGSVSVKQQIGNYLDVTGIVRSRDFEPIGSLLKNTIIDASSHKAMEATGRYKIDYCIFTETHDKVTNSTDADDYAKTSTATFTNMRVGAYRPRWSEEASVWEFTFLADKVAESHG